MRGNHDSILERLLHNPSMISNDKIIMACKEPKFFRLDGSTYAQPDLICLSEKGDLYIVEYKESENAIGKAKLQLERDEHFVRKYLKYLGRIKTIAMYGNFEIK